MSISSRRRGPIALVAGGTLALGMLAAPAAATAASAAPATSAPATAASAGPAKVSAHGCVLDGGRVKHVIYIQFDNTHLSRDSVNVPSDLEQMPNLLNFITGNGTMISHEHTPLIAHTADDIVTSESGLYGSNQGMPIANEYNYYTGTRGQASDTTHTAGSFAYWTDPIVDYTTGTPLHDSTTTMVAQNGKTPPAPWAMYTRGGCDFGSVAAANTELENTTPDVPLVYGAKSWEAKEAENPKLANKASADFMGLSVHCARASALCKSANGGVADKLPDEPGGYTGYNALYGNYFIHKVISPSGPVTDLNGKVIKDSSGDIGFPGYNGLTGSVGLAYTLDMQTHGVPVTFTYLTALHDSLATGAGLGPGSATYEQQLKLENAAFGTFFTKLAKAGINKSNTMFVFTSDEGDHFVGGTASPANCNGVKILCTYKNVGEVDGNLTGLLSGKGITSKYDVAADSAPIVYVHGQPGRTVADVRALERASASLVGYDLAHGAKKVKLINEMADPVEMKILHMITGDPRRTATAALFANPEFWLSSGGACSGIKCFSEPQGQDAWNHGDVSSQINTTWLGLVGPGVSHLGIDARLWSDHTDIVPTLATLLGLHPDYQPDGRTLVEVTNRFQNDGSLLVLLGDVYSQLNAAVGSFGLDTLTASTKALTGSDATYNKIENALIGLGGARDAVAAKMRAELLGTTVDGRPFDPRTAQKLIKAGEALLKAAAALAMRG